VNFTLLPLPGFHLPGLSAKLFEASEIFSNFVPIIPKQFLCVEKRYSPVHYA